MKAFDYVEIRIPAKPQYVSVIRLTISGLAIRVGFSYDEIEDLKIATGEAVQMSFIMPIMNMRMGKLLLAVHYIKVK